MANYQSQFFLNYSYGATSTYANGSFTPTTYVSPAGGYISDNNPAATQISVGDQVTLELNATNYATGTYLGFYLAPGGVEHPFFNLPNLAANDFILGEPTGATYPIVQSAYTQGSVVCYRAGTRITTNRGEIAVEALRVGDTVVTASGNRRPIRWLGHRTIECQINPLKAWPVRISCNAFGPGVPHRDVYVSPEHSICVKDFGNVLIPAECLINGSTVAFAPMDKVTYWHVELDSHDILLAEGLPAESFLEMGHNRRFFAANSDVDVPSRALTRTHADFCRPFRDHGPLVQAVREHLNTWAALLGWTPEHDPALRCHADRCVLPSVAIGCDRVEVAMPAALDVSIGTDTFVPATLGEPDARRLGFAVYGLSIKTATGMTRKLSLDGPDLAGQFHDGEREEARAYRWTKGELVIPAALQAGLPGPLTLRIHFEASTIRRWRAPKARYAAEKPLTTASLPTEPARGPEIIPPQYALASANDAAMPFVVACPAARAAVRGRPG